MCEAVIGMENDKKGARRRFEPELIASTSLTEVDVFDLTVFR
jgi:hypothetical protein